MGAGRELSAMGGVCVVIMNQGRLKLCQWMVWGWDSIDWEILAIVWKILLREVVDAHPWRCSKARLNGA